MNRRQFIKRVGVGLTGYLLSACHPTILTAGRGSQRTQTPFHFLTVTPQPTTPTAEPSATFSARQFPALVGEEEAVFLSAHDIREGDTGWKKKMFYNLNTIIMALRY